MVEGGGARCSVRVATGKTWPVGSHTFRAAYKAAAEK